MLLGSPCFGWSFIFVVLRRGATFGITETCYVIESVVFYSALRGGSSMTAFLPCILMIVWFGHSLIFGTPLKVLYFEVL